LSDNSVFACRSCVDPRENGFYQQHGLPVYNGFFMTRTKGSFVPKPSPSNDISNTCVMLVKEGKDPMTMVQGHRDCAAVRISYAAASKKATMLDSTDREFLRSYGEALEAVQSHAGALQRKDQLRILERICVLQDINNLYSFRALDQQDRFQLRAYAHYSMTPTAHEPPPQNGADIPLMIFDPQQGIFTRGAKKTAETQLNEGIRLIDLVDLKTFRPHRPGLYEITKPTDLDAVARNEVRAVMAAAP
jgi:carbonic anhydrase